MRINKPIAIVCLFVFVLTSCVPKNKANLTIEDNQLFQVFMDVKIAETALAKQEASKHDSLRTVYKEQISKLHGIPYSTIEDNLIELQRDPKMQKLYYERLRDSLALIEK